MEGVVMSWTTLAGERGPIKVWAPPGEIEGEALDQVMAHPRDLVEPVPTFTQLRCVKG